MYIDGWITLKVKKNIIAYKFLWTDTQVPKQEERITITIFILGC